MHEKWHDLDGDSRREVYKKKAEADCERYWEELAKYDVALDLDESWPPSLVDGEGSPLTDPYDSNDEERRARREFITDVRNEQRWCRYRADHPAYNKLVAPTHPIDVTEPFPFFRLPTELRVNVYEHLLTCPTSINVDGDWPFDTRLLTVSHRVYAEALRAFYASNCFHVKIGSNLDYNFEERMITESSGTEPPFPTALIRRWRIEVFCNPEREQTTIHRLREQLETLSTILKCCKKIDEITFRSIRQARPNYSGPRDSNVDSMFDPLWDVLNTVRGIGNAVFTDPREEFRRLHLSQHTDLGSPEKRSELKALMESSLTS